MRGALGGPRLLLRRLREVMVEPVSAQARLDKIVIHIAANMVAEVCSVYVLRADGRLELFATEGLNREAVHLTAMRTGEGLVGLIAETAEPLALAEVITQHGPTCDLMIIDCLTFFAANLLDAKLDSRVDEQIAIHALSLALQSPPCSVVLVSNEVGSGVVPEYPSGRRFRDLLGEINQIVARVASNVLLLVAGLPLVLKGEVTPQVIPQVTQ